MAVLITGCIALNSRCARSAICAALLPLLRWARTLRQRTRRRGTSLHSLRACGARAPRGAQPATSRSPRTAETGLRTAARIKGLFEPPLLPPRPRRHCRMSRGACLSLISPCSDLAGRAAVWDSGRRYQVPSISKHSTHTATAEEREPLMGNSENSGQAQRQLSYLPWTPSWDDEGGPLMCTIEGYLLLRQHYASPA